MNNQPLQEPEQLKQFRQKQLREQIIGQKFNEQYPKLLETRMFPASEITDQWLTVARYALNYTSPLPLGCYGKAFNDLINIRPDNINLLQFSMLNNNIERCSADQLKVPLTEYGKIVIMTGKLADKWDALVKDLRDELEKKLNREQDEAERIASKQPFKPVKAEA